MRIEGPKRSKCGQGHFHPSGAECSHCDKLEILRKAGEIKEFKTQHKLDLRINGKHITTHYVDFHVIFKDGHEEFHEVKGFSEQTAKQLQPQWIIKRRLTEVLFPDIPYVVIRPRYAQNNRKPRRKPWHGQLRGQTEKRKKIWPVSGNRRSSPNTKP